jgi:acetyl-CoA decarbonylase/synthase complex subunit beta
VCVITPDKPSPCGISYISAERRPDFYQKVDKGERIGVDEYGGVNRAFEELSEGKIKKVKIHSVLDHPSPSGLLQQLIIFYIPEQDGFGIVDRNYPGKTPTDMTFRRIERPIMGKQVKGFVGASYAYLKSDNFIIGEGGWDRVVWVSPNVEKFLRIAAFTIG